MSKAAFHRPDAFPAVYQVAVARRTDLTGAGSGESAVHSPQLQP
jgi:hypothetical protein